MGEVRLCPMGKSHTHIVIVGRNHELCLLVRRQRFRRDSLLKNSFKRLDSFVRTEALCCFDQALCPFVIATSEQPRPPNLARAASTARRHAALLWAGFGTTVEFLLLGPVPAAAGALVEGIADGDVNGAFCTLGRESWPP